MQLKEPYLAIAAEIEWRNVQREQLLRQQAWGRAFLKVASKHNDARMREAGVQLLASQQPADRQGRRSGGCKPCRHQGTRE